MRIAVAGLGYVGLANAAILAAQIDRLAETGIQRAGLDDFLAEHEGREFLGTVTDRLLSGESAETALTAATTLPDDLAGMEKAWKDWLRKLASR